MNLCHLESIVKFALDHFDALVKNLPNPVEDGIGDDRIEE
jgi:hypothetical protein